MARGLHVFEVDIRTHYFNKLWLLSSSVDWGVCGGWLLRIITDRLFLHYFSPFINPHWVRLDSVWLRNTASAFPTRSALSRQKNFTIIIIILFFFFVQGDSGERGRGGEGFFLSIMSAHVKDLQ